MADTTTPNARTRNSQTQTRHGPLHGITAPITTNTDKQRARLENVLVACLKRTIRRATTFTIACANSNGMSTDSAAAVQDKTPRKDEVCFEGDEQMRAASTGKASINQTSMVSRLRRSGTARTSSR